MNKASYIAITAVALCGCFGLNLDQQNDTQLGDDDADADGGTGGPDVPKVVDHGQAQYCVDRWNYNADVAVNLVTAIQAESVSQNERWWSPRTRSYQGVLDISDKPSPMVVPHMCGAGDPLMGDAWEDPTSSCLVSGYHVSLPTVVPPNQPGAYEWPYSADLVTGTIGNPPESGRHTWMAEQCCSTPPTPTEIQDWLFHPDDYSLLLGNKSADCAVHVEAKGVHPDVLGYFAPYDALNRIHRTMVSSMCVNNHATYNPATLAPYKAASLGTWLPFHSSRKQESAPLNINFEWASSLGLIEWDDFAAFGETIDAVIAALITVLYLPPADFVHPRYGGGSGCAYSAALKFNVDQWQARITCPYGYYASLPDFDGSDLETRIDGVVGVCVIDGVGGGGTGSGDSGGAVVAAPPGSGHMHLYYVRDITRVADEIDIAWSVGGVTSELADLLVDHLGHRVIEPGDTIAWWSSPGIDKNTPGEALRRTLGYDVDGLMDATGWTRERAEAWADTAPPVLLDELLPEFNLLEPLASRRGNDLRARNTWAVRVERDGFVRFLYLRAS